MFEKKKKVQPTIQININLCALHKDFFKVLVKSKKAINYFYLTQLLTIIGPCADCKIDTVSHGDI